MILELHSMTRELIARDEECLVVIYFVLQSVCLPPNTIRPLKLQAASLLPPRHLPLFMP
jgi:hypothetical protein